MEFVSSSANPLLAPVLGQLFRQFLVFKEAMFSILSCGQAEFDAFSFRAVKT